MGAAAAERALSGRAKESIGRHSSGAAKAGTAIAAASAAIRRPRCLDLRRAPIPRALRLNRMRKSAGAGSS